MSSKPATPAKASKPIAKAPIRRLMKFEGANLVADEALDVLIAKLTEVATKVVKEAVKIVKADNRKRLTAKDIQDAAK